MGPIALFDKSFIEMLNIDESAIFDALFGTNICPIYFVEVLADLQKEKPEERTKEKIVRDLAGKTPILHSYPNVMHTTLCEHELLGQEIEMREVPAIAGARPVRHEGDVGLIFEESPEAKAFSRWQKGQFHELEREFAREWRHALKNADHAGMAKLVKQFLRIHASPKNLNDALSIASDVVNGTGQRFLTLKSAYAFLGLSRASWRTVLKRWKSLGGPPLSQFAPFTAHCLLVDVFFHIAVDKRLISPDRSSNRTDIAYLYYTPFAMLFVSNDKLHRRTVPLFLNDRQLFVGGSELKEDLQKLDKYYANLPEVEQDKGLFGMASRPPNSEDYLTARIWKKFGINLEPKRQQRSVPDKVRDEKLAAEMKKVVDAVKLPQGSFSRSELSDARYMSLQRMVPAKRGKWRLLPQGVENAENGS